MNIDAERLRRWTRRARPAKDQLAQALVTGGVASLANAALFVGALGLLVASAQRPGLHAVAFVLVIIELFAFLRSPLRFGERLAAHRLGFGAVVRWRQWLLGVVGSWDYNVWRSYASGDLLQRALDDTDGLQDLWLRFLLPALSTALVMATGDVVVAALPPHGHWLAVAVFFLVVQLLGVAALLRSTLREFSLDAAVRRARGHFRSVLVEVGAAAPELALLKRQSFLDTRLAEAANSLAAAERRYERGQRTGTAVVLVVSVLTVLGFFLHATSSPVWIVVVAAIALATYDGLTHMRLAFLAAVHVNGSAERLEEMDVVFHRGETSWPSVGALSLQGVTLREGSQTLFSDISLSIAPGTKLALTGASGSGKSTLLRALAGLSAVDEGSVLIGATDISTIDESELRSHLSYLVSEPGLTRGFARDVLTLGRLTPHDPFAVINALGVKTEPTTRYDELSRGERVRVGIAQSSATAPLIYLLDEPTAALGAEETKAVLNVLDALQATIIIATHDAAVMAWCDDVLVIENASLHPLSR